MQNSIPPYVILGCGYVGTRLAQSLLADGAQVRVCARRTALLEPLRAAGAQVHYLEASRSHQFGPAMLGFDQPVVIYSIPGVQGMPQGEAVRRAASAALRVHARAFVYLGSSAVYGRSEGNSNSDWVDEETSTAPGDPEAAARLADEAALQGVAQGGLRTVLLRLSAIYGPALAPHLPARGVRQRLRSGQYKLFDGGKYYFSRIFVDDLVRIIRTGVERPPASAPLLTTYVVGDDRPCPQGEYGTWLANHLHLPMPPSVDAHLAGSGQVIRGRRLNNARLKSDLKLTLRYPSYVEGEAQIDDFERTATLPTLRLYDDSGALAPVDQPTGLGAPSKVLPALALLSGLPSGTDIGVALGGATAGIQWVRLQPNTVAPIDAAYVVLRGPVRVTRGDQVEEAGGNALIPAGATVFNGGPEVAELIAVRRAST